MTNRRSVLKQLALAAGAAAMARPGSGIAAAPSGIGRIDVHHHIVPPAQLALGARAGFPPPALQWSVSRAIEAMDKFGIATGISSILDLKDWGQGAPYRKLIRDCNEYAARLRSDYPNRFGMFASLPWPDVDATLREIAYAYDTLKADGVFLWTNYGNYWFGDARFAPVFEELNRRKAVIFTHPRSADCCREMNLVVEPMTIEWQTDTTRALAQYILSGSAAKYPDLRVIFSHGGGTMTSLILRLAQAADSEQGRVNVPGGFFAAARRQYYDTALQFRPEQLIPLKSIVGIERILFGTDYPFSAAAGRLETLSDLPVFDDRELAAIYRGNAELLFPGIPR